MKTVTYNINLNCWDANNKHFETRADAFKSLFNYKTKDILYFTEESDIDRYATLGATGQELEFGAHEYQTLAWKIGRRLYLEGLK